MKSWGVGKHLLEDAKTLNITVKELGFILPAKDVLESFALGLEAVTSMFEPAASAG